MPLHVNPGVKLCQDSSLQYMNLEFTYELYK